MIRASPRLVARQMDHFLDDSFFLDYDELLDRCCGSSIPTLNISGFRSGFIFNRVIFERFLSAFKGVWGWVGHGFQWVVSDVTLKLPGGTRRGILSDY